MIYLTNLLKKLDMKPTKSQHPHHRNQEKGNAYSNMENGY